MIVQKLTQSAADNYALAEKYYSILSAVNKLKLTEREIQLMAFTAVRGNMSYANIRDEFCKRYETTSPTINNMISKLKKMGIMIKDKGKIKVTPLIILDFTKDVVLQITLLHKTTV
jgi:hypothetical protein